MQTGICIFRNSAGALLLAMASAMFLVNLTAPVDAVQPRDPIILVPLDTVFWIVGGTFCGMALICFFADRPAPALFLIAWLAMNFLVCRVGLYLIGCRSLAGYLGGFAYAFGIPATAARTGADVVFGYFLAGSCVAILLERGARQRAQLEKAPCPSGAPKILEDLKISCPFCQGHIEFPAYALGRKIQCPHCSMNILLVEPG